METSLHQLKWGIFNLLKGDMISEFAKRYGEWSETEVQFLINNLAEDDNVIEVGSNIGMHSVPLAKAIPQGRLFCFEPQRIIYQQLCCNLNLNSLVNVYAFNSGVGNQNTVIETQSTDYNTSWNYGSFSLDKGFSTESPFHGATKNEMTPIIKLDSQLQIAQLTSLKLLKIDAEGFELKVLKGAQNTIKKLQPLIFIEAHLHSCNALLSHLRSINYRCYWFVSKRYRTNNYFNNPNAIDGYDINFICYPQKQLDKQQIIPPDYLVEAEFISGDEISIVPIPES
ncbi:FkbM family methyltransferase [Aggregatibacter kilianii]|uniref:FkbM family methyltransferase n=1 Tax=Aggregatibacter kilianii TaxID=2025884 RepID=UPI000D6543FC|nr:FkbM family methyltransferase [Aggregatibacter kilianii]